MLFLTKQSNFIKIQGMNYSHIRIQIKQFNNLIRLK